jgi:hypothetical protein
MKMPKSGNNRLDSVIVNRINSLCIIIPCRLNLRVLSFRDCTVNY